jgi:hypothetical protein
VVGTFNGLPEGSSFWIGSDLFQISYTGGSGNDVVLTHLTTVPVPNLMIERVPPASVRLLWPTNGPPVSLQSSTNLIATNWTAVIPAPVIIGTNKVVTNTADRLRKYYRLYRP